MLFRMRLFSSLRSYFPSWLLLALFLAGPSAAFSGLGPGVGAVSNGSISGVKALEGSAFEGLGLCDFELSGRLGVNTVHNSNCGGLSRANLLRDLPKTIYAGRITGGKFNRVLATVEDFNPRLYQISVGSIEGRLASVKYEIFEAQASSIAKLSNAELVAFRIADPISSHGIRSGLQLTGGHHRINEIVRRINAGLLDPNTKVQILLHNY